MTAPIPFESDKDLRGLYRHYKGQDYRVLGKAKHSETLDELVVYQALYGNYGVWVRPAAMFFGNIDVNESVIPRFTKIKEEQP